MKKIGYRDLEEGMILAKALSDSRGRVLLEKGEVLKALYVRKLQSWKISEIYIEDASGDVPSEGMSDHEFEAGIANIDQALERNFRETRKRQNMAMVHEAARAFLVERLKEGR